MKKALIWGINAYPTSPLQGCINDLVDYANTFISMGFSCITLTDGFATKAKIIAELKSLVSNAKSGDILAIAGSSHGSYIADQNGDEITDHRDEIICPIDFPTGYIRDDELKTIFAGLRAGVTCDIFLDCCFSGTATRVMNIQPHKIPVLGSRYLRFTGKVKTPKITIPSVEKFVLVPTMKETLYAASKDNQTSSEILVGGVPRGAFSYYICKGLREFPNYTRDQLINYVKNKITLIGIAQTPQLECKSGESTQLPFT